MPEPSSRHHPRTCVHRVAPTAILTALTLLQACSAFARTDPGKLLLNRQPIPPDSAMGKIGGVNPRFVKFDPSIRFIQTSREDPVIDTIIVIGNEVTAEFVILREMKLKTGDAASQDAMRRDEERLESLHLFSRADIKLGSMTRNRIALIVEVTELWYIWPGLYISVDENDPTRASYGGIISHDNFRGRREFLAASARIGYITGFDFEWDVPYLSKENADWGLELKASFTNEDEPKFLKDRQGIQSRQRLLSGRVGYNFNLENYGWVEARARSTAFESNHVADLHLTESSTGEDVIGELEAAFEHDTRTYKAWPDNAYVVRGILGSGAGLNGIGVRYLEPQFYAAGFYTPLRGFHLASRLRTSIYIGDIPVYERLLLDRDNSLRTSMLNVFEGRWQVLASAEARADLLPIKYYTYKIWNPVNRYTRNLKFGISTTLLTDYGTVGGVKQPSPYSRSDVTSGWDLAYGVGLIFHIPYRDMIRAELMRSAHYPSDGLLFRIRLGSFF